MVICPNCKRIIVDTTQDGGYKVRARMIIFKDNKATAICPTCKANVEVPLYLKEPIDTGKDKKFIINV